MLYTNRCGLFDPVTEEPYPTVLASLWTTNDTVTQFICQVTSKTSLFIHRSLMPHTTRSPTSHACPARARVSHPVHLQIFGPREGGRYNLSVALLGQVVK